MSRPNSAMIKLLLADDSATIQKVVGLTFAAEKVSIEAASDGGEALTRIRAHPPDIVLADVFLPGRNGYELCEAIKADPDLALIPVVLLVGALEAFDENEATRVQCDAFLNKPFDTSELIQIVRHLVKQHQAARAAAQAAAPPKEAKVLVASADASPRETIPGSLVTERTRNSFLGAGRILDLFDIQGAPAEKVQPELTAREAAELAEARPVAAPSPVIPFPAAPNAEHPFLEPQAMALSQETIDDIVEKVVRRMSEKVVREIAWEVVPDMSEAMIRQYLDELKK